MKSIQHAYRSIWAAVLSLLILLIGKGALSVYVYVILFGLGYGGMLVLGPATMLNYFGSENYAGTMGIAMTVGGVLGAISPLLVGRIKDMTGSYVPAFVLMMGLAVAGAVCAFVARPPVPNPASIALEAAESTD